MSTNFENQLRDALARTGSEVAATDVPPPRFRAGPGGFSPVGPATGLGPRPAVRSARWLAPAAAAAAVLAVAAAAALAAGLRQDRPADGLSVAKAPRYYIAVTGTRQPYYEHKFVAGIYATSTGALLAKVTAPGRDQAILDVSAAADDRTFVIAAKAWPKAGSLTGPTAPVTFYLVRFNSRQHRTTITGVAMPEVPAGDPFSGFALSPDGTKLAVAYDNGTSAAATQAEVVRVLNIRTGVLRTWTGPRARGVIGSDGWSTRRLSWAADNSTLAFNWVGVSAFSSAPLPSSGLRLLNTTGQGRALIGDSRLAVRVWRRHGRYATAAGYLDDVIVLVPDGKVAVAGVTSFTGRQGYAEFSAGTGRPLMTIDQGPAAKAGTGPNDVMWSDASGGTMIVWSPAGHPGRLGILRAGQLTLLPQPARVSFPAAAW